MPTGLASCTDMPVPYHLPLDADHQRRFGIQEPQPFALADKVRFSELDMLGHVNNVEYLRWFETARVKSFIAMGLTAYGAPEREPRIVIRHAETDWLAEMHQDEPYIVTARVASFRASSFVEWQEVWVRRETATIKAATMNAVLVTLAPDGSGRFPLPSAVRAVMQDVHGAQDAR
ncbi:thioesterase family protein [Cognatishimia sp. F0-27]|uniref:acyl-CoA thioesterase n=1 Tax=Cognatishimia sp. F0-27 TaxID=2816855 RepID=UPI001D0CC71E|nr:acyl-CoA thioesterase [Cognatishimia sp. F0-27]MCC1493315.1 acyl-CoA thioesterase [Cognatishimia sp. F0-27]